MATFKPDTLNLSLHADQTPLSPEKNQEEPF